jgi:hypothetical protein
VFVVSALVITCAAQEDTHRAMGSRTTAMDFIGLYTNFLEMTYTKALLRASEAYITGVILLTCLGNG